MPWFNGLVVYEPAAKTKPKNETARRRISRAIFSKSKFGSMTNSISREKTTIISADYVFNLNYLWLCEEMPLYTSKEILEIFREANRV